MAKKQIVDFFDDIDTNYKAGDEIVVTNGLKQHMRTAIIEKVHKQNEGDPYNDGTNGTYFRTTTYYDLNFGDEIIRNFTANEFIRRSQNARQHN